MVTITSLGMLDTSVTESAWPPTVRLKPVSPRMLSTSPRNRIGRTVDDHRLSLASDQDVAHTSIFVSSPPGRPTDPAREFERVWRQQIPPASRAARRQPVRRRAKGSRRGPTSSTVAARPALPLACRPDNRRCPGQRASGTRRIALGITYAISLGWTAGSARSNTPGCIHSPAPTSASADAHSGPGSSLCGQRRATVDHADPTGSR